MSEEKELKPMELLRSELPQLEAIMALNADAGTDIKTLVLQELEYLRMHMLTNTNLMDCLPQTYAMAVKSVIKKNLSLDPAEGLVYVKTRNVKIRKADGQEISAKALEIQETANGLISIYRQCGRILDIKNPVVDKNKEGKVTGVYVEILLPSVPEPRWEKRSFDESDFMRWRIKSHQENGRYKQDANIETLNYANANYTSWKGGIDQEFARAKAVRHGLKKLGRNQNEGKFTKINISVESKIVINEKADLEATNDETTHYAEVVESTVNETAIKPNTEFTKKEVDL